MHVGANIYTFHVSNNVIAVECYIYIFKQNHTDTHLIHIYTSIYINTSMGDHNIYIYMYIHTYIHTCTYIHIHIRTSIHNAKYYEIQ